MPIAQGAPGRPGVLAIPNRRFLRGKPFRSAPLSTRNDTITGVTRDSNGSPLGTCVVSIFNTSTGQPVQSTISDVSGNYTFLHPGSGPFYLVAYKAGLPSVAGTTVNTVVAT